jgi:hypothetical protein
LDLERVVRYLRIVLRYERVGLKHTFSAKMVEFTDSASLTLFGYLKRFQNMCCSSRSFA